MTELVPKRKIMISVIMFLLALLLLTPGSVWAAVVTTGDALTIGAREVVEDDIYLFGDVVTISGLVRGDAIVFCREAIIDGTIEGSLLVFAETIRIDGEILGTARGGANSIFFSGTTSRDLMMAANTLSVSGKVGQDLFGAGNSITVTGSIGRDVLASMNRLVIDAPVGGNINAYTSELVIGPRAVVSGGITYTSGNEASIDSSALISGQLKRLDPPAEQAVSGPGRSVWSFIRPVLSLLALSLLMILLFPGLTKGTAEMIGAKTGLSAGYGALVFFGAPLVALVLLVTIIGIPISLLSMLLYIVLIYASRVFAGYFMAWLFFGRINKELHPVWIALSGVLVLALLIQIPYLGWLINLAAVIFASGAFLLYLHGKANTAEATGPEN
jgi:cytoskeletal protein CcmA (bactofilin family)